MDPVSGWGLTGPTAATGFSSRLARYASWRPRCRREAGASLGAQIQKGWTYKAVRPSRVQLLTRPGRAVAVGDTRRPQPRSVQEGFQRGEIAAGWPLFVVRRSRLRHTTSPNSAVFGTSAMRGRSLFSPAPWSCSLSGLKRAWWAVTSLQCIASRCSSPA